MAHTRDTHAAIAHTEHNVGRASAQKSIRFEMIN